MDIFFQVSYGADAGAYQAYGLGAEGTQAFALFVAKQKPTIF
jgi:hypothetical protein